MCVRQREAADAYDMAMFGGARAGNAACCDGRDGRPCVHAFFPLLQMSRLPVGLQRLPASPPRQCPWHCELLLSVGGRQLCGSSSSSICCTKLGGEWMSITRRQTWSASFRMAIPACPVCLPTVTQPAGGSGCGGAAAAAVAAGAAAVVAAAAVGAVTTAAVVAAATASAATAGFAGFVAAAAATAHAHGGRV